MLLPLDFVFRRGAVFLHPQFAQLDDPALAGHTKPKYLVILSSSPHDDPVLFVLTMSEKPKHLSSPLQGDFMQIPAGRYSFFSKDTMSVTARRHNQLL